MGPIIGAVIVKELLIFSNRFFDCQNHVGQVAAKEKIGDEIGMGAMVDKAGKASLVLRIDQILCCGFLGKTVLEAVGVQPISFAPLPHKAAILPDPLPFFQIPIGKDHPSDLRVDPREADVGKMGALQFLPIIAPKPELSFR